MNDQRPHKFHIDIAILSIFLALVVTALIYVWLFREIADTAYLDDSGYFVYVEPAPLEPRGTYGPIAFERRKLELDCDSIPECQPYMDPIEVQVKVAKLGSIEPDKTKLPEIQKYEEPEKVEEAVNVEDDPTKVKPKVLKDFMHKKAQLDKRRRKRPRKVRNLFNIDDDPRARPTRFEKIVGRMDGDVYGKGVDTEKFDTYFGRAAYELHKHFNPPTSLPKRVIQKQLVRVLITGLGADGTIRGYTLKRRAKKKGFTMAAITALRSFMPSEGGQNRLPPPPPDVLEFVNKKGVIIDLDGRLFE